MGERNPSDDYASVEVGRSSAQATSLNASVAASD